jgi:RES domain-containing protein
VLVWRIAPAGHPLFDGEGTRRFGSRWIPRGLRAVCASATLSLAALELLVHTDPDLVPARLVAAYVEIPESLEIRSIKPMELPAGWRHYPGPDALQALGRRWIEEAETAVLSVPSAIIPTERNFVLNPAHPDFDELKRGDAELFTLDPRLRA